jgi:hypothetical protein
MAGLGGQCEPEGRGAAWTEERGTSDEGRRCLKRVPKASQGHSELPGASRTLRTRPAMPPHSRIGAGVIVGTVEEAGRDG